MSEERLIILAHGNGGRFMRALIEDIFSRHLANDCLDVQADAVFLPDLSDIDGEIAFSTDGFTVQPLEFPGGDIGSLAVNGTVNDLAVSGAIPYYLSLSAIIEEGFEIKKLEKIVSSLAQAAKAANVKVVAGDTKVVPRGHGGGLYFITSGIGVRNKAIKIGLDRIQAGDKLIVSGSIGDHGTTVMLAREEFGLSLSGQLKSDCANLVALTQNLTKIKGLRFMRDPTRGGLATVAHEIATVGQFQVRLYEQQIPVKPPVQSVCEMLGYDPYYLACEGRLVAVVSSQDAEKALACLQSHPAAQQAAIIGEVETGAAKECVILQTTLGGERVLEELEDDPLPRIC